MDFSPDHASVANHLCGFTAFVRSGRSTAHATADCPAFPRKDAVNKPARLAGKLETFAERARIVHVDVDPAEINKNKEAHIPMCTTTKAALAALVAALDARPLADGQYGAWVATLAAQREEFPMVFPARDDVIIPQRAIQACRLRSGSDIPRFAISRRVVMHH